MARSMAVVLFLAGCAEDVPRECDTQSTATCESALVIRFRDGRQGDFRLRVSDDRGLELTMDCPDPDTGVNQEGAYVWVCGQAQVSIQTNRVFGETIMIGVGQSPAEPYTPTYTRGGDFCGNVCNNATIEI